MKIRILIPLLFALISFGTANALIAYMSLEDLAETAEFVVIGKVTKVSPVVPWYLFPFAGGYDRFLFDVTLSIEDDLDGKYDKDTIMFRIIDSREEFGEYIEDEQNFKVGQRVLVFIGKKEPDSVMGDAYVVVGVTQGKYTIEGNKAYGAHHLEGIAADDLISYLQSLRQDQVFRYPIPGSGIIANTLPIKKQFDAGLRFEELKCKEGLELILKSTDGSPACVTPQTKQKLIERGWQNASDIDALSKQHSDISAIKYRYNQIVNEPITDFYVKIEGTGYNYHPPKLWIENTDNKTVWTNDHITYLGGGRSIPGDFCKEYTFYSIGGPVILNATGLYTLHMSFEGRTASYDLSVKENQAEYNYPTYGEHCEITLSEQVNGYDNFIFTVSNQSMDKDSVNILVQIDDYVVIDSAFEAGNQHNFHDYGFLLTEENHTISVKSRGENAWLIQDFAISGKQWGYLSYWYEKENENPHFKLIMDKKEFYFE